MNGGARPADAEGRTTNGNAPAGEATELGSETEQAVENERSECGEGAVADGEVETANGADITHDVLFEALSNRRRRFTLHYLKQREGSEAVQLADLSAQVTAWERDVEAESLSYADRKNVHTSLSQFHAPKLEELGFIKFDRSESVVELTDRAEAVNIYVETTSGRELAWGPYMLLVSGVLSGLVFGALVGLPILSQLPRESLAAFVAVTFLATCSVFAYDTWTRMQVGHDGPPPEAADR